jgi:hypothetical protein
LAHPPFVSFPLVTDTEESAEWGKEEEADVGGVESSGIMVSCETLETQPSAERCSPMVQCSLARIARLEHGRGDQAMES